METSFADLIEIQKKEKTIQQPPLSTYYQIEKALIDFTDNIQINVNKTRLRLSLAINGPPGASRQIQRDGPESIKDINKEFDKLEIYLNNEIQKLKIAKNNVTNLLQPLDEYIDNDFTVKYLDNTVAILWQGSPTNYGIFTVPNITLFLNQMKNKDYETDCDGNAKNIRMYNGDLYSFGRKTKLFSNIMVINKETTNDIRPECPLYCM